MEGFQAHAKAFLRDPRLVVPPCGRETARATRATGCGSIRAKIECENRLPGRGAANLLSGAPPLSCKW